MESCLIYNLPPLSIAKTSKSENPKTYIFIAKDEESFTVFSNERKHFVMTSPFESKSKGVMVDVEYRPDTNTANLIDYKYPNQEFEEYRLEAINYLLNKKEQDLKPLEHKIIADIKKSFLENSFESKETLTAINQKDEADYIKELEKFGKSRSDALHDLREPKDNKSEIIEFNLKRFRRYNAIIAQIKYVRGNSCELCGTSILMKNGQQYVEAAHITPKSEKGIESLSNIILLCPNHHKEFDLGNKTIDKRTDAFIKFTLNGISYPPVKLIPDLINE